MGEPVNVQAAKTHLSQLLARVERGEEVVISRGGVPVAKLTPLQPPPPIELGFVLATIPDTFFEPLPDDELDSWEGRSPR